MKPFLMIIALIFFSFTTFAQNNNLIPFEENGEYGFKDTTGFITIMPAYDDALDFTEGLAAVKKGKKWGYVDITGREAIPFLYNEAFPFSEGLARVKKGRKYGYVDHSGKLIIKPVYSGATDFQNGNAIVIKYTSEFTPFGRFSGGTSVFMSFPAPHQLGGGMGMNNEPGWIISDITAFKAQGLIDKTGKVIIPVKYRSIEKLNDSLYKVKHQEYSRFGIFDITKGKEIIPVKYGNITLLDDDTFEAQEGKNKFTYFDQNGEIIKKEK